jgi:GTPase SAR1 family protein
MSLSCGCLNVSLMQTVLRCNVLLLGDKAVGKTSLLHLVETGEFLKSYSMTSEPAPHVIPVEVDGAPNVRVELHILDVCGHSVFYPLDTGLPMVRWPASRSTVRVGAAGSDLMGEESVLAVGNG